MAFSITVPYLDSLMGLPGGQITAFVVLLAGLAIIVDISLEIVLRVLKFLVGKTKTTLDDRLLKAAGAYLPAFAIITALWVSLEAIYPGIVVFGGFGEFDLYIIVMLALTGLFLSSIADAFMLWYGIEIRTDRKNVREDEVFPFVRNVIKISIVLIFAVFILHRMGFETGAIITGLGVGGIAVALALQDTLGNFFGGLHILIDKPFREDDYIRLDGTGVEGTVKQIGWRTTRIETVSRNEIVIPNSKLSGSILENYSSPDDWTGVSYEIGIDYREDIDETERIITDALKKVAKGEKQMDAPSIWVRFDSFGDYSLNFKFGYLIKGYIHRFAILKKVERELFYEFRKNDINIPFPVRVMYPPPKEKQKEKK
ncbi:MAG TPA: mechanosensitive ion channel family protein [Candidatus Bilamarchaeum sp.]|nr:mechanosensitive ion channel family protein [Candidatus Bilamarchaeum sp.]